jgi:hypothetical protein
LQESEILEARSPELDEACKECLQNFVGKTSWKEIDMEDRENVSEIILSLILTGEIARM